MKKEIKASPNKSKNHPMNAIWIEESRIEYYAENYDSLKWYRMPKYWIYLWAILGTLLGTFLFAAKSEIIGVSLVVGLMFLPFVPFIIRGYVFPFVLLMLFKAWSIAMIPLGTPAYAIMPELMLGIVWMGLCITSIRIEIRRYKKFNVKKRLWRDMFVALGIFAVGFAILTLAVSQGIVPPTA